MKKPKKHEKEKTEITENPETGDLENEELGEEKEEKEIQPSGERVASKPNVKVVSTPSEDLELPEADKTVVEHHRKKAVHAPDEKGRFGKTDTFGTVFNPEIHQTSPKTGEGIIVKYGPRKGKWQNKRGQKKKALRGISEKSEISPENEIPEPPEECKAAAAVIVQGVSSACTFLISDEWRITNPKEFESMADPLATYLESKGVKDIPPGVAVAIAFSAYGVSRIRQPKTMTKAQKLKGWFAKKAIDFRSKKVSSSEAEEKQKEKADAENKID